MHASATIPKFDLVASPCCEVDIQVAVEWQWFDAIDFTVVIGYHTSLYIFVPWLLAVHNHICLNWFRTLF